jgi:hypothetical protein
VASLLHGQRQIRYEYVNGLTQYLEVWQPYWDALVAEGFRVAVFDLLGQGVSDKPNLWIDQDDQVAVVHDLITEAILRQPPTQRSRIWQLNHGCAVCSRRLAACKKLPSSATATK